MSVFFFILCLKISIERTNRNVCLLTHCSLCRVFNEVPATKKNRNNILIPIHKLAGYWTFGSCFHCIIAYLVWNMKSNPNVQCEAQCLIWTIRCCFVDTIQYTCSICSSLTFWQTVSVLVTVATAVATVNMLNKMLFISTFANLSVRIHTHKMGNTHSQL